MIRKYWLIAIALWLFIVSVAHADWMPDEKLRQVVRNTLGIPLDTPIRTDNMLRLNLLDGNNKGIRSIEGLQYAKNLEVLYLEVNSISDVTPLSNLTRLEDLRLGSNQISDISPLANLVGLRILVLEINQISDFRPILALPELQTLYIRHNPGELDGISLGLNAIDLQVCEIPRTDVTLRVKSRDYPSTFAAWGNIINLPTIPWDEKLNYHDLYLSAPRFGETWVSTPEGLRLAGALDIISKPLREKSLSENPNMLTLVGIAYYSANPNKYPEEWAYWLRDAAGNRVPEADWGAYLIDFTQPEAQQIAIDEAIAVAKCGLYDGIFFDWWSEEWNVLYNQGVGGKIYRPLEAEVKAKVSMLRRIREAVGDDFLILVNTNRSKIPRSAPYVNGAFMETLPDDKGGYTYAGLAEIESTLLWSEENFRNPQINCVEGWGTPTEPLDSPANQRWMRVFTTMSLTHSDGLVSLASGIGGFAGHQHHYEIWQGHSAEHARGEPHDHQHEHYYYDFWDADLGHPIGEKAQRYEGREGLFIREFTNGWAVYNRSGAPQAVRFNEKVSGVENGVTNTIHILDDLDGEIYLKVSLSADVNDDGIINILDLVVIAGAFGEKAPDVNGDGIVNILDLVAISSKMK